jgi:hypothetical protein
MSAIGDAEFLRLLKNDIDYFGRAVERFEDLIPHISAPLQDQWRLQAQARRNFALELEVLLEKALQSSHGAAVGNRNEKHSGSAPC